jgi:lysophospholipase L1-like esterase
MMCSRSVVFFLLLSSCALVTRRSSEAQTFTCRPVNARGSIALSPATVFTDSPATGGWDLGMLPTDFRHHACSSEHPFAFSIPAQDGNYSVSVEIGGQGASTTTVRAESRRLFVDQQFVPAGGSQMLRFIVNVRTPNITGSKEAPPTEADRVQLKPREIGVLDWDSKLTLEFTGDHPSIRSIRIVPIHTVPTVYLAGDSTVVDQTAEPWAAWGQMLPVFFDHRVSIANEAESGETIRSFVGERRLAKILSTIQPGDFLLVQFMHNDQKPGAGYVPAATEYKDWLRRYIHEARLHHATPVLMTAMNRRNFRADGTIVQTLGDYPQAVRDVAAEEHVALIDLNSLSKTLFEAMGEEGTLHAFVHYPANTFPGQDKELKDNTHFNAYGAYELARAVVQSLRDGGSPLAQYLKPNIPHFDPAHPDSLAQWTLPPSASASAVTPYAR